MMRRMEFRITGTKGGHRATIVWSDADGLDDPTGIVQALVDDGARISVTPTGPTRVAALEPPHVLYLTAREALDVIEAVEIDPELVAALEALTVVPDGAVA